MLADFIKNLGADLELYGEEVGESLHNEINLKQQYNK